MASITASDPSGTATESQGNAKGEPECVCPTYILGGCAGRLLSSEANAAIAAAWKRIKRHVRAGSASDADIVRDRRGCLSCAGDGCRLSVRSGSWPRLARLSSEVDAFSTRSTRPDQRSRSTSRHHRTIECSIGVAVLMLTSDRYGGAGLHDPIHMPCASRYAEVDSRSIPALGAGRWAQHRGASLDIPGQSAIPTEDYRGKNLSRRARLFKEWDPERAER